MKRARRMAPKALTDQGAADYLAGKPIEAFYDLPVRHHEIDRGAYEMGWRAAKAEARKK